MPTDEELLTMPEPEFKQHEKIRNREARERILLNKRYEKYARARYDQIARSVQKKELREIHERKKSRIKQVRIRQGLAKGLYNLFSSKKRRQRYSESGRERLIRQLANGNEPKNILNSPNMFFVNKKKTSKFKL